MKTINKNYYYNNPRLYRPFIHGFLALFSIIISPLSAYSQPNVQEPINWANVRSAKQLGDHPVFKIEIPEGSIVAKLQSDGASAKEIYAAVIAKEMLARAEVPAMRILSGNEREQFYQAMKKLNLSLRGKAITGDVVIMDFMVGTDLDEGQQLIKSSAGIQFDRLKSLGQLYAYNFFILGADRFLVTFQDKKDFPYNGLARNDNVRLANQGSKVQAIDNTIRDGLKFELAENTPRAAENHTKRIEPQIDELIFALDGDCQIARALETQIGLGDLTKAGRQAIRTGFAEALISIGFSETNFAFLLTKTIPQTAINASAFLISKDAKSNGYPQFLSLIRQFFKEKAYLYSGVEAIQNETKATPLIRLPHIATRLRLQRPLTNEESTFLKTYARSTAEKIAIATEKRERKYSLWTPELKQLDDDKDRVKRMTNAEKDVALKNIIKAANSLFTNQNPKIIEDFAYMAATLMMDI